MEIKYVKYNKSRDKKLKTMKKCKGIDEEIENKNSIELQVSYY